MTKLRLLPGEQEEVRLKPHPLSWLGPYLIALVPAIIGLGLYLIMQSNWWQGASQGEWYQFWTFLYGNAPAAYTLMFVMLGIMGAAIAVAAIRWRVFFGYLLAGILATVITAVWFKGDEADALPFWLALTSIPALGWMEIQRVSHSYILTNLRILFRGGTMVSMERQIRYESITDIDGKQSILGRIFGYGTLIPITQSGFGLGNDTSQANIMVGGGGSKGGVFGGIGVQAGGGKEVAVARARSHDQLTGVRPYHDVKFLVETFVQRSASAPYLQQQVDLQQKMVDALSRFQPAGHELPVFEGDPVQD
ncbi:MAG: PH domain-containing protein [Thermoplasmatota archaeon]